MSTTFASAPTPPVPEGWEPRWSDEYKTWFYVNKFTGQSIWELPTQPVYGPGPGFGATPLPTPDPAAQSPYPLGEHALQSPYAAPIPTPPAEYSGPGNPDFASPGEEEAGERGLFGRSNSPGHKHGVLGKVAVGVGAVALLGGAVHEWDKHFGNNNQQPPQQKPQEHHWWQGPQLPNFGPPLPQQQQQQPNNSGFMPSVFGAFTGGSGEVTGPGSCPAGEAHDHGGSWNYNLTSNVRIEKNTQQDNWLLCRKCLVLTWGNGPCSGGGGHDTRGSRNYRLDSGPAGQKNWRFCNKCHGLSFNGHDDLGKCSAGGVHEHGGSWDFGLLHDGEGGQDRWKWCRKCQQLAFDGWH